MKRNEIVEKLINEGFSEKTLVNFSDKQLVTFASRILGEQEVGGQNWGKGGTLIRLPKGSNNTNDAIRIQSDLRGDKYSVVISVQSNKKVRSEIKGNTIFKTVESMLGNKFQEKGDWTITSGIVDSNTYNKIVKLLSSLGVDEKNNTFVTQVSEADIMISKKDPLASQKIADAKKQNKSIETYEEEMKEEKPSAGLSKEKKSEVVKKAKKGEDIGKKGKGFEKIVDKAKKSGAKDPEAVAAAAMWKNVKKENTEVKDWLETIAESNFHSFTSKNEIMELIKVKINEVEVGPNVKKGHNGIPEFMSYDAISNTDVKEAAPTTKPAPTKPKVEPGTKPKTPYQPGPGKDPKPKALKEKENANK